MHYAWLNAHRERQGTNGSAFAKATAIPIIKIKLGNRRLAIASARIKRGSHTDGDIRDDGSEALHFDL